MKHSSQCGCIGSARDACHIHWPNLLKIIEGDENKRRNLFSTADHCFISFVGECCRAFLCEIIKVPKKNVSPLSQYKKDLKLLASHRVSIRKKRAHLVRQGGGFLSLILPAIASALFGLLGNVISKKVF